MNTTAKQTWIVTYGNADIVGGSVVHNPTRVSQVTDAEPVDGSRRTLPPHTIVRSNVEFEQGTISFEVWLQESTGSCQLLLPADPALNQSAGSVADATGSAQVDCELSFGVNVLGAPYGFAFLRNFKWEPVLGVGQGSQTPLNRWIQVAARVSGSDVDLLIDGVKVLSTSRVLRRGQVGLFMQGNQPIKFRSLQADFQRPLCFAVMQFTSEYDVLYKDVIKPVCEEYGFRVIRGDDFATSGQIMEDVTQSIRNAALIIADVTPDNANVFYEVGYAHAIGKPTILLSDRKREKLPFDISGFRTLFYDNTIGGKAVVEERLRQHLDALRVRQR
jgi:hypothetical protein